ncbi:MAG: hypothetical protein GVY36_12485 [Verrucomicrobia bacterium]|jgi:hypothetical protein|nr:hypothetical protein [Verrucomicrobiota bacterium]
MKTSTENVLFAAVSAAFSLSAIITASAAPVTYFDEAAFNSAVAASTTVATEIEDFSGILSEASSTSFDLDNTTPNFTISMIGGGVLDPTNSIAGSTADDGAFLAFDAPGTQGFGTVTISFDSPIQAISFLLYDLHDTTSTVPLTTISDGTSTLWRISGSVGTNLTGSLTETVSGNSVSVGNNVATFFGFSNFGNPFDTIDITNSSTTVDNAAIDNITIAVPEPATAALFVAISGLALALGVRRSMR